MRSLVKTKLVDFGVFIHVGFISGHSDTKGETELFSVTPAV